MLKKRVIIGLLINDGVLYRTKNFRPDYFYSVNFVGSKEADEVFLIDITRSGPSEASHKTMQKYADACFSPITMGGSIKSLDDVKRMVDLGADKVVLGSVLHENPEIVTKIAEKWGSQACTVACDTKNGLVTALRGVQSVGSTPKDWCRRLEALGAGEIFLQSVENDGSLAGYPLSVLRSVVPHVRLPIVVGTGCGNYVHIRDAFNDGASGAVTTNIHHLPDAALRGFKQALVAQGVPVRRA